jgi:predicted O-methyltransferase YrrM
MGDLTLAISPEQGLFAYQMVRLMKPKRIVEFGTSFGVSTVYLASGLKDNGAGKVIGSEFVKSKVDEAKSNLNRLGLLKWTDIRYGDARITLADQDGPVDMVLLDGSKDLYLEMIKILQPYLRPGSVVLADNVTSPFIKRTLAEYVKFMQNRDNGFLSMTLPFKDGFEFSIKM